MKIVYEPPFRRYSVQVGRVLTDDDEGLAGEVEWREVGLFAELSDAEHNANFRAGHHRLVRVIDRDGEPQP